MKSAHEYPNTDQVTGVEPAATIPGLRWVGAESFVIQQGFARQVGVWFCAL